MSKPKFIFELDRDKNGQFISRLKSRNGRIRSDSAESYHNKKDCKSLYEELRTLILDGDPDAIKLKDLTIK